MWSLPTIQTWLSRQKLLVFMKFFCIVQHHGFEVVQKSCFVSWLSNDGDSAIFVLQMRSGGKEELQVDFFQVISLKCVGPGLYCPQTFIFLFKHISIKHTSF